MPSRSHRSVLAAALVAAALLWLPGAGAASSVGSTTVAPTGTVLALPRHSAVLAAAKSAADYYRSTFAHTTVSPRNGWSWATYGDGIVSLYRQAGDARYLADAMNWGASSNWQISTANADPNSIKAGQIYYELNALNPSASLTAMDTTMAQDLSNLPISQYDWIDAMFMGMPDWVLWSKRTGSTAYLDKLDALYSWTRDQGATSSLCAGKVVAPQYGLYSAAQGLWYRDCTYVGTKDANGQPVFWLRGNGWVIAAMAETIQALPRGDPRATKYISMLQSMAARLVQLQGGDGFWRTSLLDPALYPAPESSGTALVTYALALGIKIGVLDAGTYEPAVVRAWAALSGSALQPTGFLTDCQGVAGSPGLPYRATAPRIESTATSSGTVNTDSPPFCVGAFLLAASAIAQLSTNVSIGQPVTYTSQQTGNEAVRVNDGDLSTRWSAAGFPQSITIDLGRAHEISNSMLVTYQDRAYRYHVDTSTDRVTWQTVVDRTNTPGAGTRLDDFTPSVVNARYVRLTVTGVSGVVTTWVSIQEFAVYAEVVDAADSFSRVLATGLGSADTGGVWALSGATTGFSVNGTGNLRLGAPGAGLSAYLDSVSILDADVGCDESLSKLSIGGATYLAVVARHTGQDDYRVKVRWVANGVATLYATKVVGGVETTLSRLDITALTPRATDRLRTRLVVTGSSPTTIRAKVWMVARPSRARGR